MKRFRKVQSRQKVAPHESREQHRRIGALLGVISVFAMTAQQQVSPKRPEAPTQVSRYRPPVKVMAFAASQSISPVVQACRPSRDWKDATSWEDAWGLNERNPAEHESLEHEWQRWVNWQDLTRVESQCDSP